MASKPTIVMVPGAWHPPTAFAPLTKLLEAAGYTCVGVKLPSVGSKPPIESYQPDVDKISAAITTAADAGEDVMVFMHSYGGFCGSAAVKGLDKQTREQQGKKGGVTQLFYCCAFAVPEGLSLMDVTQGPPPWFQFSDDKKCTFPKTPENEFYNDITDTNTLEGLKGSLNWHSFGSMESKLDYAAWKDVPSTYLICEKDQAIPVAAQRGMVEGTKGSKYEMRTETLNCSHSPFVIMPEETALAVRRAAGENV